MVINRTVMFAIKTELGLSLAIVMYEGYSSIISKYVPILLLKVAVTQVS